MNASGIPSECLSAVYKDVVLATVRISVCNKRR